MQKSIVREGLVLGIIILLVGSSITISTGSTTVESHYNEEKLFGWTPIADFSYTPEDPIIYTMIHFKDNSTDPQGTIVSWWWDFDDGYYSDLQNPTHSYFITSTYNVSLTVTNDTGFSNTVKKEVVVFEDNILPYFIIFQPKPGFFYVNSKGTPNRLCIFFSFTMIIGPIFVVVMAYDNVGIESVSFYIDDVLEAIVYEPYPPDLWYVWEWTGQTMLFQYKLKVVARDYAGNEVSGMIKVWRISVLP